MLIQLFLTIRTYFHSPVGNLYIHENDNKSYHSTHPDGHLCWCVCTWDTHKPEWRSYCNPTWISPRIRDCFGDLIRHNPKKKNNKEKQWSCFLWPLNFHFILTNFCLHPISWRGLTDTQSSVQSNHNYLWKWFDSLYCISYQANKYRGKYVLKMLKF